MRPASCPGCGRGRCPLQRARGCASVEGATAIDVAGALPLLDRAVAVTDSMVATLAHEGRYSPPTVPGDPFAVPAGRIALRIAPDRVVGAITDDDAPGGPADASMVGLVDRRGGALHRTFVTAEPDRMVVRALGHLSPADPHREILFPSSGDIGPERAAPAPHADPVDAILADEGARRVRGLCALGDQRYCQIPPSRIAQVLEFLCETGIPVGIAVFASGIAQACSGRIEAVLPEGPRLLTGFHDAAVDIDLARVDNCAVVRTAGDEHAAAIELYDASGACCALLTQFAGADRIARLEWDAAAASLCEAT
ncbi:hypothetical protein LB823_03540 [Tsukamurella sp. M9C]|uniref:hypothetical protein n=1 Tax=Tsukamurella sp. M9C TaxID=2877520 RepID=UPI001CD01665|nr:hypothetical protein [Tsukamurella sp. M9C]MCA0155269.1 hypothetical protein [Tsukamurella sp. M9C]